MYFEFNNNFLYRQEEQPWVLHWPPTMAILFMDRFETKAFNNYPLKPLIWKRFIEDIFFYLDPWRRIPKRICQLPKLPSFHN